MTSYTVASDAALLLSILIDDDVAVQAIARACLPNLTPTQFLPAFYASLSGRKAVRYTLNNHHPSDPRTTRVFQVWMEEDAPSGVSVLRWRWLSPYTQHKPSRHEFITTVSRIRRVVTTTINPLSSISGELTFSGGVPLQYIPGD